MWIRRLVWEETGAGLVMALLGALMVGGLALVLSATVVSQVRASAHSRDLEKALHSAEAGADLVVGQMNDVLEYTTSGHVFDPAAVTDERAWVLAQTPDEDMRIVVDGREFHGIRPVDPSGEPLDVVYGVGKVTGQAEHLRVVKYQLTYTATELNHGLLMGCDVTISGTAEIKGEAGNIHSDCDVELTGNVEVGLVTAAGTFTPGSNTTYHPDSTGGFPKQVIPDVDARAFYSEHPKYPGKWFDLCPDGSVREPYGDTPCMGPVHGDPPPAFDGWTLQSAQNTWRRQNGNAPGIYYVYHMNASIQGNFSSEMSVLVEADPSGDGGDSGNLLISGGGGPLTSTLGSVFGIADRDIRMTGGKTIEGLLAAHEQVHLAGGADIYGPVIAQDATHTPGSPVATNKESGNYTITYDGGVFFGDGDGIRVSSWNEL